MTRVELYCDSAMVDELVASYFPLRVKTKEGESSRFSLTSRNITDPLPPTEVDALEKALEEAAQ